jgi:DNA-directed RNA polymerase subunit M/transcription elongation factor TFIIS
MTDYPEELDTDDIEELAAYIERRYPTDELRMCDTETIHFAYWDVSHRSVSTTFLDHIQQAGYRVLHAGVATAPRRSTRRAWVECRKHESGENKTGATDANTNKSADADPDENGEIDSDERGEIDPDESDVYRVSCSHCEDEYTPNEAQTITIFGPGEVWYTCPRCGHGTNGPSPLINED